MNCSQLFFLSSLALLPHALGQNFSLARKVHDEPALHGKVASAAATSPNLFAGAKVSASSHYGTDTPALAVDGKVEPRKYWGAEKLPVWHQVELAQAQTLESIQIWPYWLDGRIYQFYIQGSLDGKKWFPLVDQRANSISGTADGFSYQFAPKKVKFVKTTITKNSMGAASGGHIVEIKGFATAPATEMRVSAHEDIYRLPWQGELNTPSLGGTKLFLHAWRGERVNGQICVSSANNLEQLHLKCTKLKGPGGSIELKANFVKFTMGRGEPRADIISPATRLDNPAGVNRSIWVSADVPRGTKPGVYKGKVTIAAKGKQSVSVPVAIEVVPQSIPAPKDWKVHLDIWQHPDAVARVHGVEPWSEEHFALMKPMLKRLADAGQKVITTTLIDEAWGGQTYDKFGSMVEWVKGKDGKMRWDYSVFDRWVEFMIKEVGIKDQISCYTMVPWSMKVRIYNEATGLYEDLENKPGAPSYEKIWGPFLTDFSAHLKKKGWIGITGIGLDERPDHMMRAAQALVKKYAPELKIISAVNSPSKGSDIVYDMSPIIHHTAMITPQMLAERKAAGKKTTFYVCTSPARPNTFTFSPLVESEWLGLFAAVNNLDGFLRWTYSSWGQDSFSNSAFGNWPDGDVYLVYPGNQSSIRFEKLRDGLEEFEKVQVMRNLVKKNPQAQKAFNTMMERLRPDFDRAKARELDYMKGLLNYRKNFKNVTHILNK